MPVTEEELKKIIRQPNADIEKYTTLSSDGRNLLTRIPKEIVDHLGLKKKDKIRWLVTPSKKEIHIEIIKK